MAATPKFGNPPCFRLDAMLDAKVSGANAESPKLCILEMLTCRANV